MSQPVAVVSKVDIIRLVNRDFQLAKRIEVLRLLEKYHSETEGGANRVRAAVLKLSAGDAAQVGIYIERALSDFRDVITAAEYPANSAHGFDNSLFKNQQGKIFEEDKKQYSDWFHKMKSTWKFLSAKSEMEDFEIERLDVWSSKWQSTGDKAFVTDPLYHQQYIFEIFQIEGGNKIVEFAAGEFSANIWGFYVRDTQ